MPVHIVVAVTDIDWFRHLSRMPGLAEVNFWSPSPKTFKALTPGELFLFKLHAPVDMIVGGGVFAHASILPLPLAWEAFGEANGAASLVEMRTRIMRYRRGETAGPPGIGCRILTQPFFLPEHLWIRPPASWARNIVSFKTWGTGDAEGLALWDAVHDAMAAAGAGPGMTEAPARYGEPTLVTPRLGQGAFRMLVTDIYARRCAITRERTLSALEAAHIRPYAEGGEHAASNGILMRRDVHSLFDAGYVTVTTDHRFEVSRRIREEFENGRDYYALHGAAVEVPDRVALRPGADSLRWHNDERYLG